MTETVTPYRPACRLFTEHMTLSQTAEITAQERFVTGPVRVTAGPEPRPVPETVTVTFPEDSSAEQERPVKPSSWRRYGFFGGYYLVIE